MQSNYATLTFTESVKAAQEHYHSRHNYIGEEQAPDRFILTDREIPFIESRDSFYVATVGENGWPYMQFRGGPKGFLTVLGERNLGFADFRGNRQYITVGNINAEKKTMLFLMDYPDRKRLKIWATSKITDVSDSPDLAAQLISSDYRAKVERLIVFTIQAYDWNCPQHITPRYTKEEIALDLVNTRLGIPNF